MHPEWEGTDQKRPDTTKTHKPNPFIHTGDPRWCNDRGGGGDYYYCGPKYEAGKALPYGWTPEYGEPLVKKPLNLDGTPVDPSLTDIYGDPKYTYYFPEQWNPKNPLYPLPPYPNRPAPPTQAELDAAEA